MLGQRRFGKVQMAVLVIIALVMGANLISPAVAHFRPKIGHLVKHIFAKADPRYYNVGEKVGAATTADSATNADKVDNLDANSLNRVAFVAPADLPTPLPSVVGTIAATTITAPVRGTLIAQAGADWSNYTASDFPFCFIRVDGSTVNGSFRATRTDDAAGVNEEENCSTEAAIVVDPGIHSVDFRWDVLSLDTDINDPILIVQFVPFSGTGVTPRQVGGQHAGDVSRDRG